MKEETKEAIKNIALMPFGCLFMIVFFGIHLAVIGVILILALRLGAAILNFFGW